MNILLGRSLNFVQSPNCSFRFSNIRFVGVVIGRIMAVAMYIFGAACIIYPTLINAPIRVKILGLLCGTPFCLGSGALYSIILAIEERTSRDRSYSPPLRPAEFANPNDLSSRINRASGTELYRILFQVADVEFRPFHNLPSDGFNMELLDKFIHDLTNSSDFSNRLTYQHMIANLVSFMQLADRNKEFRDSFQVLADVGQGSCGDRATHSYLHMNVNYKIATTDPYDMGTLLAFLVLGRFTLNLLEKAADEAILKARESNPLVDEVEVRLIYPIRLKDQLRIPIDVQSMRFEGCATLYVTDQHLEAAAEFVCETLSQEEAILNFLVEQAEWVRFLRSCSQDEVDQLENARFDGLDHGEDPRTLLSVYLKGLKALTQNIVGDDLRAI